MRPFVLTPLCSCEFMSARLCSATFCLRPYVGFPIIAVYNHFIIAVFIPHVLPTICLHCINAVVALQIIRVICGFQLSLLSRVAPNSLDSLKTLNFKPFIDKESKTGFRS